MQLLRIKLKNIQQIKKQLIKATISVNSFVSLHKILFNDKIYDRVWKSNHRASRKKNNSRS